MTPKTLLPEDLQQRLLAAITAQDAAGVTRFLEAGADPNAPLPDSQGVLLTPLQHAFRVGVGADVSSSWGAIEQSLLHAGADVTVRTPQGETFWLLWAHLYAPVRTDRRPTLQYLRRHAVDPSLPDERGVTPLAFLLDDKAWDAADWLYQNGARPATDPAWHQIFQGLARLTKLDPTQNSDVVRTWLDRCLDVSAEQINRLSPGGASIAEGAWTFPLYLIERLDHAGLDWDQPLSPQRVAALQKRNPNIATDSLGQMLHSVASLNNSPSEPLASMRAALVAFLDQRQLRTALDSGAERGSRPRL